MKGAAAHALWAGIAACALWTHRRLPMEPASAIVAKMVKALSAALPDRSGTYCAWASLRYSACLGVDGCHCAQASGACS